jgi:hypothetical protein
MTRDEALIALAALAVIGLIRVWKLVDRMTDLR